MSLQKTVTSCCYHPLPTPYAEAAHHALRQINAAKAQGPTRLAAVAELKHGLSAMLGAQLRETTKNNHSTLLVGPTR